MVNLKRKFGKKAKKPVLKKKIAKKHSRFPSKKSKESKVKKLIKLAKLGKLGKKKTKANKRILKKKRR